MSDLGGHISSFWKNANKDLKGSEVFDKHAKVVTNTISNKHLNPHYVTTVKEIYKDFGEDEKIELIWSNNGEFAYDAENVLVGITNYRIFSLEKGNPRTVFRGAVNSYDHVKRGAWRWDELECTMKDGTKESILIYHKVVCAHFCEYLASNPAK